MKDTFYKDTFILFGPFITFCLILIVIAIINPNFWVLCLILFALFGAPFVAIGGMIYFIIRW